VCALKITKVELLIGRLTPTDKLYTPFVPKDRKYFERCSVQAGGYYVVYKDGYESFSPAEAFEEGYTLIE